MGSAGLLQEASVCVRNYEILNALQGKTSTARLSSFEDRHDILEAEHFKNVKINNEVA